MNSRKWKKFQEGLNDRIRPHIIASRLSTFAKTLKKAMSLKEDFRCKPSLGESWKKQWPFGSPQNKGQGQESKETSEGEQSFGKGKNVPSQPIVKRIAPVVVSTMKANIVQVGLSYATYVNCLVTLLTCALLQKI